MSKYKKNADYRSRNLAKGLCEKCPTVRNISSKRFCDRHLLIHRKRVREAMRKRTQGGVHVPEYPDCGYFDRPCKGINHRQPQISQREWIEMPYFDKFIYNAIYQPPIDRWGSDNGAFFGSSDNDPLSELLERELHGEDIFKRR